jgi:hypothetical protein
MPTYLSIKILKGYHSPGRRIPRLVPFSEKKKERTPCANYKGFLVLNIISLTNTLT